MDFNATSNIIFDGRAGGVGTDKFIQIENTTDPSYPQDNSTSKQAGPVIRLREACSNILFQYCQIYGETEWDYSTPSAPISRTINQE